MNDQPTVAVWFSCGAASAVAAKIAVDTLSATHTVRVVNTPIDEEDEDNRRFLRDVETWIGQPVEIAINEKYGTSAVDVWQRRSFMSGPHGAPCTLHLKKEARYQFEDENKIDFHVLGFTADEVDRHERFVLGERPNVLPLLIEAGLTKTDCARMIMEAGIALPRVYAMGYPNANCLGCVKASSATYWSHVRRTHPEVYAARAEQSRQLGARLVRYAGERMYLDELPMGAEGRPMDTLNFSCGLFCEEHS